MDADTRMLIREVTGAIVQAINRVAKAQASQAAVAEVALTPDQRSLIPDRLRSTGPGR